MAHRGHRRAQRGGRCRTPKNTPMEPNETPQNQAGESPEAAPEVSTEQTKIVAIDGSSETLTNKELRLKERRKLANKIRRLLALAKGPAEICRTLSITPSKYRYAVAWMTKETFGSNLEAFSWFHISGQAELERLEMLIVKAEGAGDIRAAAMLSKVKLETRNQMVEVALKLGILDREAIKVKDVTAEVGFGDESQAPWFTKEPIKTEIQKRVQ